MASLGYRTTVRFRVDVTYSKDTLFKTFECRVYETGNSPELASEFPIEGDDLGSNVYRVLVMQSFDFVVGSNWSMDVRVRNTDGQTSNWVTINTTDGAAITEDLDVEGARRGKLGLNLTGKAVLTTTGDLSDIDGPYPPDVDSVLVWTAGTPDAWVPQPQSALTGVPVESHDIQGAKHTASGLTVGQVLRATATTAFAFGAIQASDLPTNLGDKTIGTLTVTAITSADSDTPAATIGRVKIGNVGVVDVAGFSHRDQHGSTTYALIQTAAGATALNAAAGQPVDIKIGGTSVVNVAGSTMTILAGKTLDISGTIDETGATVVGRSFPSHDLTDHDDVDVPAPSQGDVLYYSGVGEDDWVDEPTGLVSGDSIISVTSSRRAIGGALAITHSTAAGFKHLPSGGSAGQWLKWGGSSGVGAWTTLDVSEVSGAAPLASPTFTGTVTLPSTAHGTSLYDGLWINDGGVIKYRTKAQVLSDIGAASVSHNHDGVYSPLGHSHDVADLGDTSITGPVDNGEVLVWQSTDWINQTLAEAGIQAAGSYVPTSRNLTAGNGLTGGGDLSADRTFHVGAGTGISVAADAVAVDYAVVGKRQYNSALITSAGWYRIASDGPTADGLTGGDGAAGIFTVQLTESGRHASVTFSANYNYNNVGTTPSLTLLNVSGYNDHEFLQAIRIVAGDTYEGAAVEIYIQASASMTASYYIENNGPLQWIAEDFVTGVVWTGATQTTLNLNTTDMHIGGAVGGSAADEWYITRQGLFRGSLDMGDASQGTLVVGRGGTGVTSLSNVLGTTNQVTVSNGTARVIGGNVTLSLPQNIHTAATPTFAGLTLSSIAAGTADYDRFLVSDSGLIKYRTGADVLSDIGAAASGHTHGLEDLDGVTITEPGSGEVVQYNGSAWINRTLAEAGIAAASHVHAAADVTSGTFANARIAQSNVTQHQGALAIAASQITSGTLVVARGGTGLATVTAKRLLVGNGTSALNEVSDVSAQQGWVLAFHETNGPEWIDDSTLPVNSHALGSHSDVTITSPATNQVLKYNGSIWVNAAIPAQSLELDDLTDVDVTDTSTNNFLKFTGTDWTSENISASDVPSLDAGKITTGVFAVARIPDLSAAKITSGTLAFARGGTGISTWTGGDMIYVAAGAGSFAKIAAGEGGQVLTWDSVPEWQDPGGGADVFDDVEVLRHFSQCDEPGWEPDQATVDAGLIVWRPEKMSLSKFTEGHWAMPLPSRIALLSGAAYQNRDLIDANREELEQQLSLERELRSDLAKKVTSLEERLTAVEEQLNAA